MWGKIPSTHVQSQTCVTCACNCSTLEGETARPLEPDGQLVLLQWWVPGSVRPLFSRKKRWRNLGQYQILSSRLHIHSHRCTHSHLHTNMHTLTHACTHTRTHLHLYTLTLAHTHIDAYTHTCTHSHLHTLTHAYTRTDTHSRRCPYSDLHTLTHAHTIHSLTLKPSHT